MKWTDEQKAELQTLCFERKSNVDIAAHFGVPPTEIHAKRSQLGITRQKVEQARNRSELEEVTKGGQNECHKYGLESFNNGLMRCTVLARTGNTALILIGNHTLTPFVVPGEHRAGASDWWQGHYFSTLEDAWTYYKKGNKQMSRLQYWTETRKKVLRVQQSTVDACYRVISIGPEDADKHWATKYSVPSWATHHRSEAEAEAELRSSAEKLKLEKYEKAAPDGNPGAAQE